MKWNHLRHSILLLASTGLATAVCSAQQPVNSKAPIPDLVTLSSDQWMERAKAYEQLRSDSTTLHRREVQAALLNLLDHENHVVESALRESHEQAGASAKYGEEYGEYVSELIQSVDSFANWNDPRQVCIFVRAPYDPGSRFAAKIASHAKVSAPCLAQMYSSDLGVLRGNAAAVLVRALANRGKTIDAGTVSNVRQIILGALHDSQEGVRIQTINALGRFGNEDIVPALRQVAEADPAPGLQGHSVKTQAARAIAAIEKRSAQGQR
jgi:hypothetical protein